MTQEQKLKIEHLLWVKPGVGAASTGKVPERADFFQDHFPKFPVLPGVLAVELMRLTVEAYFRKTSGAASQVRIRKLQTVKFSKYLRPGQDWEVRVEVRSQNGTQAVWSAKLIQDKIAAVSAQITVDAVLTQEQSKVIKGRF